MAIKVTVTTSMNAAASIAAEAKAFAASAGCTYVPRGMLTVSKVIREDGSDGAIIFASDRLRVSAGQKAFFFHPNMAKLRILALAQGKEDRMASVMQLKPGDRVLDCTCGLASDAIVASHVVGKRGTVLALEASQLLAYIVQKGLQTYQLPIASMVEAMRQIEVRHASADAVLSELPDKSWDVVYFDPMFDSTLVRAKGLDIVRLLGQTGLPSSESIRNGVRVARRSVVMKDQFPGMALQTLGFKMAARSRRVCFGSIDARG